MPATKCHLQVTGTFEIPCNTFLKNTAIPRADCISLAEIIDNSVTKLRVNQLFHLDTRCKSQSLFDELKIFFLATLFFTGTFFFGFPRVFLGITAMMVAVAFGFLFTFPPFFFFFPTLFYIAHIHEPSQSSNQ